jgi:tetraacyldisaccharide 4'-kinase
VSIYYSKYKPLNIRYFRGKKLFAFAGIGNPENFFDLLVKNNLNLKKKISFPDHHHFNKKELQVIVNESLKKNLELITTEKDYIRIKNMGIKNIGYLELKLEITKKNNLIKKINDYL